MIPRNVLPALLLSIAWPHHAQAQEEISGPEKLTNGTFDEAGQGDEVPFANWAGRASQGGEYTFGLAEGKTGKAAKISGTKTGRAHLCYNGGFPAKAGEVLRIRFWAKTENLKGGIFANLEGEPNNNGWHKINIGSSTDWQQYETRVTVPKGANGQEEPKIGLWFYHFGTGDFYLDEISATIVTPDDGKRAQRELTEIRAWGDAFGTEGGVKAAIDQLVGAAGQASTLAAVRDVRVKAYDIISRHQGADGGFAIGITSGLSQVFLDEDYHGGFGKSLNIALARNESEGAQINVISTGTELKGAAVTLDGDLVSPAGKIPASKVKIDLVGFVDTTEGKRPYQSTKLGWWPDPLLPNGAFDVKAGEVQPLLVTVTTDATTAPGLYSGGLTITSGGRKVALPVKVRVHPFTLPVKSTLTTLVLGSGEENVTKFYGQDPGGKIADRMVLEASKLRMPPGGLLNGWGWKTPGVPKKSGGGYDFTKLDRWIDIMKPYVTRFPIVTVPRFRKFGGGEYDDAFKSEMEVFLKAYAAHLKQKGIYDAAVFYNLDEASNHEKLLEWDICKEMYDISKKTLPDMPVMQCLNEFKGVQALSGHADIWDLYYGQYEQAGGPEQLKSGHEITLSVCVWPSERPNIFVEYPLVDARILPWICYREGAKGFEYWDLYQTWPANAGNLDWWKAGGTRTTWNLVKNHGDGLLLYPGPDGTPLSSLRMEALRDGLEDHDYLALLEKRGGPKAEALLKEAREVLVTGVTTYDTDPAKLLNLRERISAVLSTR